MKEKIKQKLEGLAQERSITILFACESGSRAWGFPSPDSDYDVRFIYHHPIDWYLSINDKKEDITLDIDENLLDLSGWELRKALRLFSKSNAAIYSWLVSPIIYHQEKDFLPQLQQLTTQYFNPKAAIFHYLGLTKKIMATELQKEVVKLKKYFYVLRPVLCAKWIATYNSPPPMLFHDLLPLLEKEGVINEVIADLLLQKEKADEGATIAPIPLIHDFARQQMEEIVQMTKEKEGRGMQDISSLDEVFRGMIR